MRTIVGPLQKIERCTFVIRWRFIIGVDEDGDDNELGYLELIHNLVETLDKYFENVCELDIMFNLEKAHFILEEMVMDGCVVDTNKSNILQTISLVDKHGKEQAYA